MCVPFVAALPRACVCRFAVETTSCPGCCAGTCAINITVANLLNKWIVSKVGCVWERLCLRPYAAGTHTHIVYVHCVVLWLTSDLLHWCAPIYGYEFVFSQGARVRDCVCSYVHSSSIGRPSIHHLHRTEHHMCDRQRCCAFVHSLNLGVMPR